MDEYTHEKRYGKILEVHRIVSGSDYAVKWGVCVTLCDLCHDALHGTGYWGWIAARHDKEDKEQLARQVRRSSERDFKEEREWRRREAWGGQLRKAREAVKLSQSRLAIAVDVLKKTVQNWEAGRCEPLFSEAKKLAKALDISLDDLAGEHDLGECEHDSDEAWLTFARERSAARALAFWARDAKEGEIIGRGARLVREVVERDDQDGKKVREAAQIYRKPPPTTRVSFG